MKAAKKEEIKEGSSPHRKEKHVHTVISRYVQHKSVKGEEEGVFQTSLPASRRPELGV